jgi:hypothetical protein
MAISCVWVFELHRKSTMLVEQVLRNLRGERNFWMSVYDALWSLSVNGRHRIDFMNCWIGTPLIDRFVCRRAPKGTRPVLSQCPSDLHSK